MKITIHTDGSSRGNPGPGGWAAVLVTEGKDDGDEVVELGGREDLTTNNRMELMGAIMGLREIDGGHQTVRQQTKSLTSHRLIVRCLSRFVLTVSM